MAAHSRGGFFRGVVGPVWLGASVLEQPVFRAARARAQAKAAGEKAHWERMGKGTPACLAEIRNWTPELPEVTFSDHLIIHDRAHQPHGFLPYIGDGYRRERPPILKSPATGGYGRYVVGNLVKYNMGVGPVAPREALGNGVRENVASTFQALEKP